METAQFYSEFGSLASSEFETTGRILVYITDIMDQYGDKELAENIVSRFELLLKIISGNYNDE